MAATTTISLESIVPINTDSNRAAVAGAQISEAESPDAQLQRELNGQININGTHKQLSRGMTAALIAILTGINVVGSFSTGLLTVALPRMAQDLHLPDNLTLW